MLTMIDTVGGEKRICQGKARDRMKSWDLGPVSMGDEWGKTQAMYVV